MRTVFFLFFCSLCIFATFARELTPLSMYPEFIERDRKNKVQYFPESERIKRKVVRQDGCLYFERGRRLIPLEDRHYIFVIGDDGEIYANPSGEHGVKHSSFFGPQRSVLGAGEFQVINGEIRLLRNGSGHYKPSSKALREMYLYLEGKGFLSSDIRIEVRKNVKPSSWTGPGSKVLDEHFFFAATVEDLLALDPFYGEEIYHRELVERSFLNSSKPKSLKLEDAIEYVVVASELSTRFKLELVKTLGLPGDPRRDDTRAIRKLHTVLVERMSATEIFEMILRFAPAEKKFGVLSRYFGSLDKETRLAHWEGMRDVDRELLPLKVLKQIRDTYQLRVTELDGVGWFVRMCRTIGL